MFCPEGRIVVMASFRKNNLNNRLRKKVLWVSSLYMGTSLHQKSKIEIMGSLIDRGYASTLIALRSTKVVQTGNSQVSLLSIPLKQIPIISRVMYTILLIFILPLQIIISKPDYIITDPHISVFSFISVITISKLTRIKLILDVRSIPVEVSGFRGFLKNLLFTTSISFAKRLFNGITIITPLMKKEICGRFRINPETVGVWSSGVSKSLFDPKTYKLSALILREKLGLTGKFVVLYHGVFSANRGLAESIEAMSIVKNANKNVIFMLLGTGPYNQKLRDLIREKELQNNVIIHGPVEHVEVPKFIEMCDIGIVPMPNHPYWQTQSPLKLLEYLAMSKVVVLTSIPAHWAVVGKEKCGIYISSAEPVEIAKSIIYTYDNREELRSWGASGRRIVEEKYTWEKVAADLESYLLSIDDVVSGI